MGQEQVNKIRKCAVYIFDGFADHEIALVMSWLNSDSDFAIETFSASGQEVTSMSGLKVCPHTSLQKMDPDFFDLLLLPGGEQWEKGDNLDIFPLISETIGKRPVAAICSATLALADLGLLNDIPHTSNFPGYILQFCPDYTGSGLYRADACVNAGTVITANGRAIAELADEILSTFGICKEEQARNRKESYQSGGQNQSGKVQSGQNQTGQVQPGKVQSVQLPSGQVQSGQLQSFFEQ